MKFMKKLKLTLHFISERASCRVFVANSSTHRKVLIVADEAAIKNLLMLVRKVDNRRLATANGRPDLSTISRRSFDTAILDLRCPYPQSNSRGYNFEGIWPSMVGKVLVITAEVNNLKTVALVEKYIRQRHTLRDIVFFLKTYAQALIGRSPWPQRV